MPTSHATRWIKVLWLGASLAALVNAIAAYWPEASPTREPSIAFPGFLLFLSFPLGFLGFFILGLVADVMALTPLTVLFEIPLFEIFLVWAGLTAVGWFQWFVFIPWLFHALRRRLLARDQRGA